MQVDITGVVVQLTKAWHRDIIDESDDSDVDESLQYSVKMTPFYRALYYIVYKQWLSN